MFLFQTYAEQQHRPNLPEPQAEPARPEAEAPAANPFLLPQFSSSPYALPLSLAWIALESVEQDKSPQEIANQPREEAAEPTENEKEFHQAIGTAQAMMDSKGLFTGDKTIDGVRLARLAIVVYVKGAYAAKEMLEDAGNRPEAIKGAKFIFQSGLRQRLNCFDDGVREKIGSVKFPSPQKKGEKKQGKAEISLSPEQVEFLNSERLAIETETAEYFQDSVQPYVSRLRALGPGETADSSLKQAEKSGRAWLEANSQLFPEAERKNALAAAVTAYFFYNDATAVSLLDEGVRRMQAAGAEPTGANLALYAEKARHFRLVRNNERLMSDYGTAPLQFYYPVFAGLAETATPAEQVFFLADVPSLAHFQEKLEAELALRQPSLSPGEIEQEAKAIIYCFDGSIYREEDKERNREREHYYCYLSMYSPVDYYFMCQLIPKIGEAFGSLQLKPGDRTQSMEQRNLFHNRMSSILGHQHAYRPHNLAALAETPAAFATIEAGLNQVTQEFQHPEETPLTVPELNTKLITRFNQEGNQAFFRAVGLEPSRFFDLYFRDVVRSFASLADSSHISLRRVFDNYLDPLVNDLLSAGVANQDGIPLFLGKLRARYETYVRDDYQLFPKSELADNLAWLKQKVSFYVTAVNPKAVKNEQQYARNLSQLLSNNFNLSNPYNHRYLEEQLIPKISDILEKLKTPEQAEEFLNTTLPGIITEGVSYEKEGGHLLPGDDGYAYILRSLERYEAELTGQPIPPKLGEEQEAGEAQPGQGNIEEGKPEEPGGEGAEGQEPGFQNPWLDTQ